MSAAPPSPIQEKRMQLDRYVSLGLLSSAAADKAKLELLDLGPPRGSTPASAAAAAAAAATPDPDAAVEAASAPAPAPAPTPPTSDLFGLIAAGTIPAAMVKTHLTPAFRMQHTMPAAVKLTPVPTSTLGPAGVRAPHARAPLVVQHPTAVPTSSAHGFSSVSSTSIVTFKNIELQLPFFSRAVLEDGAAMLLTSLTAAAESYGDVLIDGPMGGGCGCYWSMTLDVRGDRVVLIEIIANEWLAPGASLADNARYALLNTIRRVGAGRAVGQRSWARCGWVGAARRIGASLARHT